MANRRVAGIGQRFGVQQEDIGVTHHVERADVGREFAHEGVVVFRIKRLPRAGVVTDRDVLAFGIPFGVVGGREIARRRAPLDPAEGVVGIECVAVEHHPDPMTGGGIFPLQFEDRFPGVFNGGLHQIVLFLQL